jgi:hypothetical protein
MHTLSFDETIPLLEITRGFTSTKAEEKDSHGYSPWQSF